METSPHSTIPSGLPISPELMTDLPSGSSSPVKIVSGGGLGGSSGRTGVESLMTARGCDRESDTKGLEREAMFFGSSA